MTIHSSNRQCSRRERECMFGHNLRDLLLLAADDCRVLCLTPCTRNTERYRARHQGWAEEKRVLCQGAHGVEQCRRRRSEDGADACYCLCEFIQKNKLVCSCWKGSQTRLGFPKARTSSNTNRLRYSAKKK
eukprot:00182_6